MKKIMILALAIGSFMAISCSDDDSTNSQVDDSAEITGTWEPTNIYFDGDQSVSIPGQTIDMTFSAQSISFDQNTLININTDNTYEGSGGYTMEMTMDYMGQEISQEMPVENFFTSGTWERNGNQFTTTEDGSSETGVSTIEILNATTLKLIVNDYDVSQTMPNVGANSDVTVNVEMTMQRVQ